MIEQQGIDSALAENAFTFLLVQCVWPRLFEANSSTRLFENYTGDTRYDDSSKEQFEAFFEEVSSGDFEPVPDPVPVTVLGFVKYESDPPFSPGSAFSENSSRVV